MRVVFSCLLVMSSLAAAAPAPGDVNHQLEAIGFIRWRAEVDVQVTKTHSHTRSNDSDERHETYNAHLSVVEYGPPASAPIIDLQEDPSSYPERHVSGSGSMTGSSKSHYACHVETSEISASVMPDASTAKVEFHWNPMRQQEPWSVSASVHFAGNAKSNGSRCVPGDCPDAGCKTSSDTQPWSFDAGGKLVPTTPGVQMSHHGDTFAIDGKLAYTAGEDRVETVLHVVVRAERPAKYEAVLMPRTQAEYEQWIPEGPKLPGGDDDKGGNSLAVVLQLRDAKTHKPVSAAQYTPTYTLDTSHAPGWCMDYPKAQTANDKPDLYFRASDNRAPLTIEDEGTKLVGVKHAGDDVVIVASRDYGAYGKLHAHIVVADGYELDAVDADHHDGFALPLDRNDNHIADAWEKSTGIYGKKYPSTWDGETDPAMASTGDGYDLYEEYRGFYLSDPSVAIARTPFGKPPSAKYQRLDPHRRDLLVAVDPDPRDGALLRAGALAYAGASGVIVRFVTSPDQLAPTDGDGDAAHPRWANFNAHPDAGDFGPKQAAIWLRAMPTGDNTPGKTVFLTPTGDGKGGGTPMKAQWIAISSADIAHMVDTWIAAVENAGSTTSGPWQLQMMARGLAELHLQKSAVFDYARAHRGDLHDEIIVFSTMHELGHATGAHHHGIDTNVMSDTKLYGGGDPSCPMRYWNYMDYKATVSWLAGKWNPAATPPGGGTWHFCTHNFLGEPWYWPQGGTDTANLPQMKLHE